MTASPEPNGPRRPELTPSAAEHCRTLVASARSGALATLARDPDGFPYASLVTVAADASGSGVAARYSSAVTHAMRPKPPT